VPAAVTPGRGLVPRGAVALPLPLPLAEVFHSPRLIDPLILAISALLGQKSQGWPSEARRNV
jgi:hypothetical protein